MLELMDKEILNIFTLEIFVYICRPMRSKKKVALKTQYYLD